MLTKIKIADHFYFSIKPIFFGLSFLSKLYRNFLKGRMYLKAFFKLFHQDLDLHKNMFKIFKRAAQHEYLLISDCSRKNVFFFIVIRVFLILYVLFYILLIYFFFRIEKYIYMDESNVKINISSHNLSKQS